METSLLNVGVASAVFILTHLGLSTALMRKTITEQLGEKGFLGLYSLIALLALIWLIMAYINAPQADYLWIPGHGMRHLPMMIMPFALIFVVGGFAARNPSVVGMESHIDDPDVVRGILRITRHPVQWGVILWSGSHILANGDLASLLFFGGFLVVAALGSVHQDSRMAVKMGDSWRKFASMTSHVPFLAIILRRQKLALKEQLWPLLIGLALFVVLLFSHPHLFGVRPF